MSKDINDNENEENEEYFQDEETKNINRIEVHKNNNINLINQETMSGEEYNNQEFYESQDIDDIHELDVDLNNINKEYNLANLNNEDERIYDINKEIEDNFNEEIGYPNNEMKNIKVNTGDENNYINHNNNSVNNMNMENIGEENNNNNSIIINNISYYDDKNNIVNFDEINENNNRIINQNLNNNLGNIESLNYLNIINNNNADLNEHFSEEENNIQDKMKLINNIKNINEHFINIENKFKNEEKENLKLKKELANEKHKNKQIFLNNSQNIENFKKQGNILFDNAKKKNAQLTSIINDLEIKNILLNYQLIEARKKIEKLENELRQNKKDENNSSNNNNKENKDNKFSNEIKQLKDKIYENEIIISKLNYDKKKSEENNENLKKENIQKTNYIVNYKNNEINLLKKMIKNYEMYFKNNNTNNYNNNMHFNASENNNDKKCWLELANKEKIIKNLILKFNTLKTKFKNVLEILQLSNKNNEELQMQMQEIVNDKNELIIQNQNNKIKLYQFISLTKNSVNTLRQYKYKNNTLKQKIKELYGVINRLKNRNYFIYKNNDIYNNYLSNTANNFYKVHLLK